LTNNGTIIQNDGRLLPSNGAINNESGALYDLQVDNGIFNNGGSNPFDNAGTLRKSAGSGTSSLNVDIDNIGTVEVDSGTLELTGAIPQFSGDTLTGGGWTVLNGSTLSVPAA